VTLVASDKSGCTDTMIRRSYIRVTAPTARFSLSDTIAVCPPLTVSFTSNSLRATRQAWNFGNTGTSVLSTPVSTYTASGLYTVYLAAIDGNGCTDTAFAKVRVLGYAGALSYPPGVGCRPLTVTFTSSVTNVPSLVWDFADGNTQAGNGSSSVTHTYTTIGKFLPKLIFSDGHGCTASSDGLDTIRVDGVEAGFRLSPACERTPVQLTDTSKSYFSSIAVSRWDLGPLGVLTGNPITRTFTTPGEYPVTLISTSANGCKDTLSSTIRIYPLPKILAPDDTSVCVPDAITLRASGGRSYVWAPGAGLSCTACNNPVATPTAASAWVVTGTDSLGCVNRDTVRVAMQTRTSFKVSDGTTICIGDSYRLAANGATLYSWAPPQDLDNPESSTPLARPKTTTTYVVTGREGSCLPDTHQVRVIVRPIPNVDAGGDLRVIAGNAVQLQASGNGIQRVSWDTDASLSCHECFAPEARPKQTTMYRITAYNEFGCKATDSVRVLVLCDGNQLFLPNTFTPNGDGQNDFFYPQGAGFDRLNYFRIYSRWGELLYEKANMPVNDAYIGWNGTHNGAKLNPDVYVYVLEARCDTGEPLVLKGDVTLVR
jgi:gliding motility-associated-like protein